jgi:DNA-binding HxlR family transcriptional regulator
MLGDNGQGPEDCRALSDVLGRIGDRWTILIVGLLGAGPKRFNEIRRTIDGISQRMLTLTLRALERDGLVIRTQYPTNPPAVEYALTKRGKSLLGPLTTLAEWGRDHRVEIEQSRVVFDQEQAERTRALPRISLRVR